MDELKQGATNLRESPAYVVNIFLLVIGYLTTGVFATVGLLLAFPQRSTIWESALWAAPFVSATLLWVAGVILFIVLIKKHPWAAIRTARYLVIIVAAIAVWIVSIPLLATLREYTM